MNEITKYYDIGEEIGRGAFAVVKVATEKSTGKKYAIKLVETRNIGQDLKRLATEIGILRRVSHPNIISLKDLFETPQLIAIVTELVTGGELFDKIVELGSYSEVDAAKLVANIVDAIHYLHGHGIVHRDLKPENLLLEDEKTLTRVKIADFGLSRIVGKDNMSRFLMTACGTPSYVAPEVLKSTGYDKEVDLWSIGVITYILLCGFPPFYNEVLNDLFEEIMSAKFEFPEEYWENVSAEAKDFISKLLVADPDKRMTSEQAIKHPWLSEVHKRKQTKELNAQFKSNLKSTIQTHKSQIRLYMSDTDLNQPPF